MNSPPGMSPPTKSHVELRSGAYADSVALLQVSRDVAAIDGVLAAQVAMATPLNVDVLAGMGFDVPAASPNDMVVARPGSRRPLARGRRTTSVRQQR